MSNLKAELSRFFDFDLGSTGALSSMAPSTLLFEPGYFCCLMALFRLLS